MNRLIVEKIKEHINTNLSLDFHEVALWNNQVEKARSGVIESIPNQCIYISFPDGSNYDSLANKVQRSGEIIVRFYIVMKIQAIKSNTDAEILSLFDLKDKVYSFFSGFQFNEITPFERVREFPDESRENFYIFEQDYSFQFLDDSLYIDGDDTYTATLTPQITTDLIINPATVEGVRTAKDVNDG